MTKGSVRLAQDDEWCAIISGLLACSLCRLPDEIGGAGGAAGGQRRVALATLGCGLVVMALPVGTFAAINTASINLAAVGGWFVADIAVNLIILFVANALVKKAAPRSS